MPISQADYEKWLDNEGTKKILLAKIQYFDLPTSSLKYYYFSNIPFVDTVASPKILYRDRIAGPVTFRTSLPERGLGLGGASWGSLLLQNSNGDLDFLTELFVDGYAIEIKIGDPSWPLSDFKNYIKGLTLSITAPSSDKIEIKIRSRGFLAERNINQNFFQSGDVNAGNPHPIAFGNCFNISPVKVLNGVANYNGGKWQCHTNWVGYHGPTDTPPYFRGIKEVFDDGVPLTRYAGAFPIPAGQWQEFEDALSSPNIGVASGFYLGSKPAGVLTCDYRGELDPFWDSNIAAMAQSIGRSKDPALVAVVSAIGIASFKKMGFFTSGLKNILEIINQALQSQRSFGFFNGNSDLEVGTIIDPEAITPAFNFNQDSIIGTPQLSERASPSLEVSINYFKNWTKQDKLGAIPGGYENRAARSQLDNLFLNKLTGIDSDFYPFAKPSPEIESLLHGFSTNFDYSTVPGPVADTFLTELKNIEQYSHHFWNLNIRGRGFLLKAGTPITVNFPRFDLSTTKKMIVLEATNYGNQTVGSNVLCWSRV